jgi:SAM-dependent methyltransferase
MGIPEPKPDVALFKTGQGTHIYHLLKHALGSTVRLAEIGCGTGQVMREFAAAAARDGTQVDAAGCEYAPAYVAAGQSAGSTIRLGSIETLVDLGPFDVVIMSHVLEHFTNVPHDLATVSDLTSGDGIVYVEVPGLKAIHTKPEYDYDLAMYLTLAHTYHFTLGTLSDVMARAGYALFSGDEHVRAVFRPAAPVASAHTPLLGDQLLYLEWLRDSPRMRAKRSVRRLRRFALDVFRRTVGMRGYEAARSATRSIRSR